MNVTRWGPGPGELRALADGLVEREVDGVVMESTAQDWRPAWEALELHLRLTAAGAGWCEPIPARSTGTSTVESWARRPQEGFSGRGTSGEAPGRAGAHLELCARRRAAAVAHGDAT